MDNIQTRIDLHHRQVYQSIFLGSSPNIAAFFNTATKLRKRFVLVALTDKRVEIDQAVLSRKRDFKGYQRNFALCYLCRVASSTTCCQRNTQNDGVRISRSVSYIHIPKSASEWDRSFWIALWFLSHVSICNFTRYQVAHANRLVWSSMNIFTFFCAGGINPHMGIQLLSEQTVQLH